MKVLWEVVSGKSKRMLRGSVPGWLRTSAAKQVYPSNCRIRVLSSCVSSRLSSSNCIYRWRMHSFKARHFITRSSPSNTSRHYPGIHWRSRRRILRYTSTTKNDPGSGPMTSNILTITPLDPFDQLPNELLAKIFFYVVESPLHYSQTEKSDWEEPKVFDSPRLPSSVCRRWRSIALATSRLWVNVRVGFEMQMEGGYERTLLKQWLERSGQNLISLKIGPIYRRFTANSLSRSLSSLSLNDSLEDVTGIVISVLHRCKAIYIESSMCSRKIRDHFVNGVPSLRELYIKSHVDEDIMDLRSSRLEAFTDIYGNAFHRFFWRNPIPYFAPFGNMWDRQRSLLHFWAFFFPDRVHFCGFLSNDPLVWCLAYPRATCLGEPQSICWFGVWLTWLSLSMETIMPPIVKEIHDRLHRRSWRPRSRLGRFLFIFLSIAPSIGGSRVVIQKHFHPWITTQWDSILLADFETPNAFYLPLQQQRAVFLATSPWIWTSDWRRPVRGNFRWGSFSQFLPCPPTSLPTLGVSSRVYAWACETPPRRCSRFHCVAMFSFRWWFSLFHVSIVWNSFSNSTRSIYPLLWFHGRRFPAISRDRQMLERRSQRFLSGHRCEIIIFCRLWVFD